MHTLCNFDLGRSEEIFEGIKRYRDLLVERLQPQRVILFGSLARGDFHQGSDVDIAVIADWKEPFLDRVGVLMELNTFGLPLEPVGYTEGEFQDMVRRGNRFALQIVTEGKVLYQSSDGGEDR